MGKYKWLRTHSERLRYASISCEKFGCLDEVSYEAKRKSFVRLRSKLKNEVSSTAYHFVKMNLGKKENVS